MNDNWPDLAMLPDHDRRLTAARRAADWYLGDRDWADQIIGYYLNPADAMHLAQLLAGFGEAAPGAKPTRTKHYESLATRSPTHRRTHEPGS